MQLIYHCFKDMLVYYFNFSTNKMKRCTHLTIKILHLVFLLVVISCLEKHEKKKLYRRGSKLWQLFIYKYVTICTWWIMKMKWKDLSIWLAHKFKPLYYRHPHERWWFKVEAIHQMLLPQSNQYIERKFINWKVQEIKI